MAGLEAIKRIYASHSMAEATYIKVKRINSPCPTVEPTSTWRVLAQVLAHLGANLPYFGMVWRKIGTELVLDKTRVATEVDKWRESSWFDSQIRSSSRQSLQQS